MNSMRNNYNTADLYRPQRAADIEVSDLPDGVALYDTTRQIAHHLNPVAMLVWELVDGRTTAEIIETVTNILEIDADEAATVTESALNQFFQLGVAT